jgi:DNA-directed RNA polymerase subunit delta
MGMAVTLSKSNEEIQHLPLVELAWEILKTTKEPMYFRDIMTEIQKIRGMSQAQVDDAIARLYTEINIDGRFLCIGQNVWGLNRWYPVDKVADRSVGGKKFVRHTGDAFSDDDEDEDEDEFDDLTVDEEESEPLFTATTNDDADEADDDGLVEEELATDEEEGLDGEEEEFAEEPLVDEEDEEEDED